MVVLTAAPWVDQMAVYWVDSSVDQKVDQTVVHSAGWKVDPLVGCWAAQKAARMVVPTVVLKVVQRVERKVEQMAVQMVVPTAQK